MLALVQRGLPVTTVVGWQSSVALLDDAFTKSKLRTPSWNDKSDTILTAH
jgi:hypothetical protein